MEEADAVAAAAADGFPCAGYSYRRAYAAQTYAARDRIDVLEIVADHFFHASSDAELDLLAEHFTLLPHGLDLSLGSADGVDERYLARFAEIVRRSAAPWWSEHVAFTRAGGISIGHLAPLPFTFEALDVLCRNLERARGLIGDVPCVLENIAAPVILDGADMDEAQFLGALVERTGCGLLLDIENLHANAVNFALDVDRFLDALPAAAVVQLHVAGGEWNGTSYIDSHARPVAETVWELTERACARFPVRAIVVERDEALPPFDALLEEIERARAISRRRPTAPPGRTVRSHSFHAP
jgi:uncharacterized protein (UPF0276 family)